MGLLLLVSIAVNGISNIEFVRWLRNTFCGYCSRTDAKTRSLPVVCAMYRKASHRIFLALLSYVAAKTSYLVPTMTTDTGKGWTFGLSSCSPHLALSRYCKPLKFSGQRSFMS